LKGGGRRVPPEGERGRGGRLSAHLHIEGKGGASLLKKKLELPFVKPRKQRTGKGIKRLRKTPRFSSEGGVTLPLLSGRRGGGRRGRDLSEGGKDEESSERRKSQPPGEMAGALFRPEGK